MAGQWPLVGRDDELELIEERLSLGGAGVAVAGPPGVGKTRLVSEALQRAAAAGRETARVVASRSASSVPFGAFSALLPELDRVADSWHAFIRRAAQAIGERELVLAIDDAHHLDDASATLAHQIGVDGRARLLVTVRSGEPVPDAMELLWKEGVVDRLELQALAKVEVDALVRSALGGPVDGALLQHLWSVSQGNALYLRELVTAAQESNAIVSDGGMWRLRQRPVTPPRLRELVESRLAHLGDDERAALELLAVAETIGMRAFEDVVGTDVLERLERRELVTVSADRRRRPVRLVHPLHGEVLRERMPTTRAARAQRTLAEIIEKAGTRRRSDAIRVAALRLGADGSADLPLLEQAVNESLLVHDARLLEAIARAGLDSGGGARFTRLLAETLRWQGRPADAVQLLEPIDLGAVSNDEDRALIAMVRADCLYRGLNRVKEATDLLDEVDALLTAPEWKAEVDAFRGSFLAQAGTLTEAIDRLVPLMDSEHPRVVLTAAPSLVPALAMAGRTDEAIEYAEKAFNLGMRMGPQPMLTDPGLHLITRAVALCDAGRLAEAEAVGHMGYEWSMSASSLAGQSWFAMVLGFCSVAQGRLVEAIEELREAANGFRDLVEPGVLRVSLAVAAEAAACRGDVDLATELLAEMDALGPTTFTLGEIEVARGRAWLEVARGRVDLARERLRASVLHGCDNGVYGLTSFALHDLVRLGDAAWAAPVLDDLQSIVQGPLHPIRVDHAVAVVAGDGPALDDVSQRYEALGAVLWAAEAASQAASAHQRAGRARAAAASEQRSAALAADCEGAVTPALRRVSENEGPATLTRREREVATLAAAGSSSRAIAQELFLSIRTVENHLQRVYTKLGVSGRGELADAIDVVLNE